MHHTPWSLLSSMTNMLHPYNMMCYYMMIVVICSMTSHSVTMVTATSSSSSSLLLQPQQHHIQRQLEIGDFDQFNALYNDAILSLQDQEISSGQLDLVISNLQCTNIIIGDLLVDYTIIENNNDVSNASSILALSIAAIPFSMDCTADYSFTVGQFINGNGEFTSLTNDNSVNATIHLISPNGFDTEVPSVSIIDACSSTVNVYDTTFSSGGLLASVLNLLESAVSQVISNQANNAVCTILNEIGGTFFTNFLNSTKQVMDEWLEPIPAEYSDPLYVENNYVKPENVSLLNFMNSNSSSDDDSNSIGEFILNTLTETDSFLNGMIDDPTSPSGTNLEINVFIRDNFLDENGTFTVSFDNFEVDNSGDFNPVLYDSEDKLSKISIRINSVQVGGLDTMTLFNPLIEIGQYTFLNELRWEKLSAIFDLTLRVETTTLDDPILSDPTPVMTTDNITISIDFEQINANASLFLAIDRNKFDGLPLGSLLKDPVVCFLSALDSFEVSGLDVSLGQFSEPTIEGFLSPGIDRIVRTLVEGFFIAYEPTLIRAVPYFFQVPVRDIIKTSFIDKFLGDDNVCLSNAQEISETSVIDFRDLLLPSDESKEYGGSGDSPYGQLLHAVFNIVKDEYFSTDPTTGLAAINKKFLTDYSLKQSGTSGRLFFPGSLINNERTIRTRGKESFLRIRLFDLYFENIDTVGVPLSLLEPAAGEPFLLNNDATVGSDRPLRIGLRILLGLSNDDTDIENDVDLFLDFQSLQVFLGLLARMSEKAFMMFPLHDITKLQCWLATIVAPELNAQGIRIDENFTALAVNEFVASVTDLNINISCVKCTGPRVPELSDLLSGLRDSADVTDFANAVFDYATNLVNGDFFTVASDKIVNDAKYMCPHSPVYNASYVRKEFFNLEQNQEEDGAISFFLGLVIVSGCLLLTVLMIVLITKFVVRRRHKKWISTLPKSHLSVLHQHQALKNETNVTLDNSTVSMFHSKSIPLSIRFATPIIILGNIGLFISGHINVAATVSIMASLAGQTYEDEGLFEFSVANTTIEIWRAGGRGLAMIIFLLSFAWPYTKQFLILGLWFSPTRIVSVNTRGSILLWLDVLGKWSIIDIFVLVVAIVTFQISIESPQLEFLPSDFYAINLYVAPKWGLYANMIAQILSQISSHWIIHYHRRIVFDAAPNLNPVTSGENHRLRWKSAAANELEAQTTGNRSPIESNIKVDITDRLFAHSFGRPHRGEFDKLITRRVVNPLLYLLCLAVSVLVVMGCVSPSYSLNKLGIVGILVEAGQEFEAAYAEFSVLTTITSIIEQASLTGRTADYIGLGSLSALIFLSVLVVPILQVIVLLIQWFAPITRKRRFRLSVLLESLQAWQYMEVYLLAVLIASWQLGPVSAFLINPYCSALEDFFAELTYYGLLKLEDAQCFRTEVGLEPTFYVLFTAAVGLALITSFIGKAVKHYFRDVDPHQNPFLGVNAIRDVELKSDDSIDDVGSIKPVPVLFTDQFRWCLKRAVPSNSLRLQDTQVTSTVGSTISAADIPERATETNAVDGNTSVDDDDVYFVNAVATPDSLAETTLTLEGFDSTSIVSETVVAATTVGSGVVALNERRGYDVDDDDLILQSFIATSQPKHEEHLKSSPLNENNSTVPDDETMLSLAPTDSMNTVYSTSSPIRAIDGVSETPMNGCSENFPHDDVRDIDTVPSISSSIGQSSVEVDTKDDNEAWIGTVSSVPTVSSLNGSPQRINDVTMGLGCLSNDDKNETISPVSNLSDGGDPTIGSNTSPPMSPTVLSSNVEYISSLEEDSGYAQSPIFMKRDEILSTSNSMESPNNNIVTTPKSTNSNGDTITENDPNDQTKISQSMSNDSFILFDHSDTSSTMSKMDVKNESKNITYNDVTTPTVLVVDDISKIDSDHHNDDDVSTNMDHRSVGSDHTPRRQLQMN